MDSLIVDFRIKKAAVKNEILGTLPIPNGARRTTDEIKREYLVTENATSPLTKAGFTVKGIADDKGEHNFDICGRPCKNPATHSLARISAIFPRSESPRN